MVRAGTDLGKQKKLSEAAERFTASRLIEYGDVLE